MKRWITAALALAIISGVWAYRPKAAEGSVVALSIEELSRTADCVVRGHVVDKSSRWNDAGTIIETTYTVLIDDCVKGTPGGLIRVRVVGGQLDGITIVAGEAPSYKLGEDVVVFARSLGNGEYETLGWFQGKLTILNGDVREMLQTSWTTLRQRVVNAQ